MTHRRVTPSRRPLAPVVRAALALACGVALAAPATARAQRRIDERHAAAPDLYFRISGSVGTLRVIGWEKDSLVITGTLPAGVRAELGIGEPGGVPARGAKMYIESPNDAVAAGGSLEVRVPARARVWIKSGTANVDARDVTGGLDVNVIGGRVRIAASPRELQVEAMDAGVEITGTPRWLRAKTASGDITVRGGAADVALTSVSGSIRMTDGSVERGRVETVTGGISFSATAARGADLTFDTHSGPIDLRLPGAGQFTLTASSVTGAVENHFDKSRPTPGREGRGAELAIARGNESARITVRSFKGTITLRP